MERFAREQAPERAERTDTLVWGKNAVTELLKSGGARLCKAAGMAHDGYARAIRPVHTSMDGDSIYAVSLGDVPADLDAVGVIGARVMAKAIVRAVEAADSAYGFQAARDM